MTADQINVIPVNADSLEGKKENQLDVDKVDGKNAVEIQSELGKNVSLNEYRSSENRSYSRNAEQDFEIGLTQSGYPDGFYDVFVDESKIASKTRVGVTTGTNGNINLITSSTADSGVESYANTTTNSSYYVGVIINPNNDLDEITVQIGGNSSGYSTVSLYEYNVNSEIASKTGIGGSTEVTLQANLTAGTDYLVAIHDNGNSYTRDYPSTSSIPFTSSEVDIVDGGRVRPSDWTYSNGLGETAIVEVTGTATNTSGSITSITQDKGYSAAQATLTADYALNGQSIDSMKLLEVAILN